MREPFRCPDGSIITAGEWLKRNPESMKHMQEIGRLAAETASPDWYGTSNLDQLYADLAMVDWLDRVEEASFMVVYAGLRRSTT